MKKLMIIIAACLFATIVFFSTGSIIQAKEKEYIENLIDVISVHLDNAQYSAVFDIYNMEDQENRALIDKTLLKHVNTICDEAYDTLNTARIVKFKEAGFTDQIVADTIKQIETQLDAIEESNKNFNIGVDLLNDRNFEEAKINFEAVIKEDISYQSAQAYITEVEKRNKGWNKNESGVNSFYNAACFDGEYLYIPFVLHGIDGIYKINSNYEAVDFFPLSDEAGTLVIEDINAVGDYIYFIAGENVGSGYTFSKPYSIYELKNDGSGLCTVLEGNFTDLYIKEDKVYAVSREHGLVEYDRNFEVVTIISSENVVEFSVTQNGIYYVEQEDLSYNSDNSLYFYDDETVIVNVKEYLQLYGFGENYAASWQYNNSHESLNYYTKNSDINIRNADIYNVYGIIDDKLMYSCVGLLGREIIYTSDLSSGYTEQLVEDKEIIEYTISGVFYEQDKLIVKQDDKIYFSDSTLKDMIELETSTIDISSEMLESNAQIIMHLVDEDIFLNENQDALISVIDDKQIWHYKDDTLNITIEKRYIDEYDSNVYVTHIFTTDYSLFATGNANTESSISNLTYKASTISDKYNMIYAQNTDTFLYSGNSHEGMIIRNNKAIRETLSEDMIVYFDDGSMEIYRYGDAVDAQSLIESGASFSFSFGPVLVDEYKVNVSCITANLSYRNPRSAVGYVEPGHYVFIACDGRDNSVSRGLNMVQLARLFEDEGCKLAYNLDGGMTTTVLFMGSYVTNRPSYESGSEWFYYRSVAEMMYFGTSDNYQADLSQYTYNYDYFSEKYK